MVRYRRAFMEELSRVRTLSLLLVLVVPVAKPHFNGLQGRGVFSTIFNLPINFLNMFSHKVEVIVGAVNEEDPSSTVKLIASQGYHRPETHQVITEDGYILEIYRIPHGQPSTSRKKSGRATTTRVPVILFHGFAQSSAAWVLNTPKVDALAFYLADRGFDVWLANERGSPSSRRHIAMDPTSTEFWDFSTHEVGVYDLAATIDFVLRETKQDRVNFVGFSKGNAAFLILNAKKPEYNDKIGLAVFLAPAYIYYDSFYYGIPKQGAPMALKMLERMRSLFGTVPILPPFITKIMHWILPVVCHPTVDLFKMCMATFQAQHGHVEGLITTDKLVAIQHLFPVPVTLRTIIHITQQMNFGEFTEYDYGPDQNMKLYGRFSPPKYNITNVRAPVAILVGLADLIGTVDDARTLAQQLPNLMEFGEIKYPLFTHADFCFADGAGKLVNRRVVHLLHEYG